MEMAASRTKASEVLCWCCSLYFLFSCTSTAQNSSSSNNYLLINCGSSVNDTDDIGREWQADVPPTSDDYSVAAMAFRKAIYVPTVPFMTARIFNSYGPHTYSIALTPAGRKFLRLYFNPSNYHENYSALQAVFNLSVAYDHFGSYTFLSQFAPALEQNLTFIKEYSLGVSGFLNLTFAPHMGGVTGTPYAFINGIEIVPIQQDIFSSRKPPKTVSTYLCYDPNPTTALETMYRVNVGGEAIEPASDSGLFRRWESDFSYISVPDSGLSVGKETNITLSYSSSSPKYIAPDMVYSTQRSMTEDSTKNRMSNLTWIFNVDPGFCYLVRLHFCEIQSIYSKPKKRVFSITINDQTVEKSADIFAWATLITGDTNKGLGVPFYKDYFTNFRPMDRPQDRVKLRIDLRPSHDDMSEYDNAGLNGLEIFKLSRPSDGSLAPNYWKPSYPTFKIPSLETNRSSASNSSSKVSVAIGISVSVLVVICGLMVLLFVKKRRKRKHFKEQVRLGRRKPRFSKELPASDAARHFFFEEIEQATRSFDDSLVIGVGGFGKVYRGIIPSKELPPGIEVAIKRANPTSEQGIHEFFNEIQLLSKLRHRHLVPLTGFCDEQDEMILVYEYMANGTLREHLYNNSGKPTLGWRRRLEISIGAATGLHYLHTGIHHTIIHRDVKTTNILLDEAWVAKVADFGLCKTGPELERRNIDLSTAVKGSFGYLDPEYYRRQKLTDKSDVYSFGVVLFEVLCSRPPLNTHLPHEQVSLAEWVRHCFNNNMIDDIVDPYLKEQIAPDCFVKYTETAYKCISDRGLDRPSMGDVLSSLESALQLQEDFEKKTLSSSSTTTSSLTDGISWPNIYPDSSTSNAGLFSEIVDPQGR